MPCLIELNEDSHVNKQNRNDNSLKPLEEYLSEIDHAIGTEYVTTQVLKFECH